MENEIWKDVVGFEGLYQVSSWGRVCSISPKWNGKQKILNGRMYKKRYRISLRDKNGASKTPLVANLVAEAFLPKEDWQDYVEHLDGNPENNRLDNLRWSIKTNAEVVDETRIRSHQKGANKIRIEGDAVYVTVTRDGREMICDKDVWDKYSNHTWGLHTRYVKAKVNGKETLFHRLVKDCPDGYIIDHINRNTLDNRRKNLRVTTYSVNCMNTKVSKNNKLGKKGIYYRNNKYIAQIRVRRKNLHIGCYDTLEDAIAARKQAEEKYHKPIIEKETLY